MAQNKDNLRFATNSPKGLVLGMSLAEFDAKLISLGATGLRVHRGVGVQTFRLSPDLEIRDAQFKAIWEFLESIHPEFRCYSYSNARELFA